MTIDEIKSILIMKGYKLHDISVDGKLAYYTNINELIVGIFDYDYPNEGYCGKIIADHEDNFDKWSKCFYMVDFPESTDELQIIINDCCYLSDDLNKQFSNNFGKLRRVF